MASIRLYMTVIFALTCAMASAQIRTDASLGPPRDVTPVGGRMVIDETLGARRGGTLFHSFERFGVPAGQSADFTGPDGLDRIVSRVTGGDGSNIDGTVQVLAEGADFIFVNPAGIRFGPDARLRMTGGAAYLSAADRVEFADGTAFSATDLAGSTLSVADPVAFGFLDRTPGRLVVDGTTLLLAAAPVEAGPAFGADGLSLSGRAVEIAGDAADGLATVGVLDQAAQVTIAAGGPEAPVPLDDLAGRARAGSITLRDNAAVTADAQGFFPGLGAGVVTLSAAEIMLATGARVTASDFVGGFRGDILVEADRLSIDGVPGGPQSFIDSVEAASPGFDPERGVTVRAGEIAISNGGYIGASGGHVDASGGGSTAGNAGRVGVEAGTVELRSGGQLRATARGDGHPFSAEGGHVSLAADRFEAVGSTVVPMPRLDGLVENERFNSGIQAFGKDGAAGGTIAIGGRGASGEIGMLTGRVRLADGAQIAARATETGTLAGSVSVAGDDVLIESGAQIVVDGVFGGQGGSISIGARNIRVDRASLDASIIDFGLAENGGAAGSVTLTAGESITLSGERDPLQGGSGIFTFVGGASEPGSITLRAPRVDIRDASDVAASGFFGGTGGSIAIEATDAVTISGESAVSTSGGAEGSASGVEGAGDGGAIEIRAPRLSLSGMSQVSTATFGSGVGGSVSIEADEIEIADRAQVVASTFASGSAGRVSLRGVDTVRLLGAGRIISSVEFDETVSPSTGPLGNGGDIEIAAGTLTLDGVAEPDGRVASVTARANDDRAGDAGSVRIEAGEIALSGGAGVTVDAVTSAGGSVFLTADDLVRLRDGNVSASVARSLGDAGNVTMTGRFVAIDEDSTVEARADVGDGGVLRFVSEATILSPGATFSVDSRIGTPGVIEIEGLEENLVGIEALDPGFFDPRSLLGDPCLAAASGRSGLSRAGSGDVRLSGVAAPSLFLEAVPFPAETEVPAAPVPAKAAPALSLARLSSCGQATSR